MGDLDKIYLSVKEKEILSETNKKLLEYTFSQLDVFLVARQNEEKEIDKNTVVSFLLSTISNYILNVIFSIKTKDPAESRCYITDLLLILQSSVEEQIKERSKKELH